MNSSRLLHFLWVAVTLTCAGQPLPRAEWIRNGMINAGGSHEPYLFLVRRGGMRLDAREAVTRAKSEETIRALKEAGVEVFHTSFYKGFGMAAELPEMQETKRAAEVAHRYGLKVDTYLQWNTMMYETFFAEEPRAQNWVQRDINGNPVMLVYGFQQSFRYRPCFANQEYLDYLKRLVKYAVEEVKTDFIHFDNYDLNPEPESCHCSVCVRRFREYLRTKYTPERRRERFGFENVDYVNPPAWNSRNRPGDLRIIYDPAIQEWIAFRCHIMADALRQMAAYAKSMNLEVVIETNPHGITGGNRTWQAGLDHTQFLKSTEVFWTEEQNPAGYLPDGRLLSKIRSYKLARAFDNILLTNLGSEMSLAEALAFNQTLGFVGSHPLGARTRKYIDFYRKHRDLYTETKDAAEVALLRSVPSLTYNHARTQLSAVLTEQALIQAQIPFVLVFDEHLQDLSEHKVLILPDSECLSDRQVSSIRGFVERGGGLVALGQTGLYDEWRRLRVKPGLAGLIDARVPARAYEERPEAITQTGAPVSKEFGKGRAVYIPEARFDGELPEMEDFFTIGNKFWKRPANAGEIADAVRWAARDPLPVQIAGPPFLVANAVRKGGRRVLVHLVNYNAPAEPASGVTVRIAGAAAATLYSPDSGAPRKLPAEAGTFAVPAVKVYSILDVTW